MACAIDQQTLFRMKHATLNKQHRTLNTEH